MTNKRLTDAAPEMLRTLILVRDALGITETFTPLGVALDIDKPIRKAIKAATGKVHPDSSEGRFSHEESDFVTKDAYES